MQMCGVGYNLQHKGPTVGLKCATLFIDYIVLMLLTTQANITLQAGVCGAICGLNLIGQCVSQTQMQLAARGGSVRDCNKLPHGRV